MPLASGLLPPGLCTAAEKRLRPERSVRPGPHSAVASKEAVGWLSLNHPAGADTTIAGIGLSRAQQFVEAHVQTVVGLIEGTTGLDADIEQVLEGGGGVLAWLEGVEQAVASAAPAVGCADHGQAIDPPRGDEGQAPLLEEGVKAGRHLLAAALLVPACFVEGAAGPADHGHLAAVSGDHVSGWGASGRAADEAASASPSGSGLSGDSQSAESANAAERNSYAASHRDNPTYSIYILHLIQLERQRTVYPITKAVGSAWVCRCQQLMALGCSSLE